ncbi:MAG: histidinol-phosphatase HisJ family protein [Bacillota bacterium]
MIPDYHIHTSLCGHARGEMHQYVEEAAGKGIGEIGFSDHVPMYWLPPAGRDPELAMAEEEFPGYVAQVLRLRDSYRSPAIRLGVEVDYIPGREEEARRFISAHPFDYVIGSVHYLDGWGFDHPLFVEEYRRRDIEEIYAGYFELLCQAAASGIFDIIAHPDLIKKFGHRPEKAPLHLYRQAARVFASSGVCVEVNTAGLRVPAGEIYPTLEFLRLCRLEGVPAVTGSDAHSPELVGNGFGAAVDLLKEAGYTGVTLFKGRKRTMTGI